MSAEPDNHSTATPRGPASMRRWIGYPHTARLMDTLEAERLADAEEIPGSRAELAGLDECGKG
jgi:hypothetical protein